MSPDSISYRSSLRKTILPVSYRGTLLQFRLNVFVLPENPVYMDLQIPDNLVHILIIVHDTSLGQSVIYRRRYYYYYYCERQVGLEIQGKVRFDEIIRTEPLTSAVTK